VKLSNLVIVSTVLLFSLASSVSAQSKYKINVTKLEIKDDLASPSSGDQISSSVKSGPTKKWAVILVHYDVDFGNGRETTPKGKLDSGRWLDTVEFQMNFLFKPKDASNKIQNYTSFNKAVKYSDIGHGKHIAALFIKPVTLKRYFNGGSTLKRELMISLSMKANGKSTSVSLGKDKQSQLLYMGGKFIKTGAKERKTYIPAFGSDKTTPLKNVVHKRNETPFAHTQYDAFDSLTIEK
jgi:hypothetical protein